MAVLQRMPQGSDVQQFSTRIPKTTYQNVMNWAYDKRLTFAAAISILVGKAIDAEINGNPYIPEKDGNVTPRA